MLAVTGVWFLVARGVTLGSISVARFPGTLDQHPAIDYRGGAVTDVVTELLRDVNAGRTQLAFDGTQGFLRVAARPDSNVPVESQILLFSKTGIQHPFTTRRIRARCISTIASSSATSPARR